MNFKKLLIIIILMTLITISCIWINYLYNTPPKTILEFNELGIKFNPYNEINDYQNKFHYQTLNEDEKVFYSCLYHSSINNLNHFEFIKENDNKEMVNAMGAFIEDWPEYYWWNTINTKTIEVKNTLGKKYYYLTSIADESEEDIKMYSSLIENKAEDILTCIKGSDDYTTIKNIHDYIIDNTTYNLEKVDSQDLRSVLLENEGVCAGYAETFQYLCNKLGYDCYCVKGQAKLNNIELHEWNIIQIDNKWYLVDTTFDEYTDENKNEIGIKYDNFLATDKILKIDHISNNNYKYPNCIDDNFYFYNMPGMFIENFSEESISPFLIKWIKQNTKELHFKFNNKKELNLFIEWLNNDGFFKFYGENISEYYNLKINWKVLEDNMLLILSWEDTN